jgi:hypothetical protein
LGILICIKILVEIPGGQVFPRITNNNGHNILWHELIKRSIETHLKDFGLALNLIKVKLRANPPKMVQVMRVMILNRLGHRLIFHFICGISFNNPNHI